MFFEDGEVLTVAEVCCTVDFLENLDEVKKGDKLYARINPNAGLVVELRTEHEEILNFDAAQEAIRRDGVGFMWLGIVLYGSFAYLFMYGIYKLVQERKEG